MARFGLLFSLLLCSSAFAEEDLFARAANVLEKRCIQCHGEAEQKGELALHTREAMLAGGETGEAAITPGNAAASILIDYVSGDDPEMPKNGKPLAAEEIEALKQWIAAGAKFPEGRKLADTAVPDADWWSLKPVERPPLPQLTAEETSWTRNEIDVFIRAQLREQQLSPSPEADRRTLIRRLTFDLWGLPPTPEQVEEFIKDPNPKAYEKLVERLLASPHYGERWARHWLDVVHYADTHGYDKDKLRPNAWPYRDYVIRSLNADKPYSRFVQEQVAGDSLFPGTADGITALGFLAAGPWDFVGHAEVPESKIDGQVARHLDRDDMVRTVMETFTSTTVGCARCHNHKFDPVSQEDYYSLQAVFAAIDRADRPYDLSPEVAQKRENLAKQIEQLKKQQSEASEKLAVLAGPQLPNLNRRIADLESSKGQPERPEFGYHSNIESNQNTTKWVQVDLGAPRKIAEVVLVGCNDNFNDIGPGFGFPVRFKIEAADNAEFTQNVITIADHTEADYANPKVEPQSFPLPEPRQVRYLRVTAVKLALRQNDYIFALAELLAYSPEGNNEARGKTVASLDSIEAPVRWQRANLVDGYYYGIGSAGSERELALLKKQRQALLDSVQDDGLTNQLAELEAATAAAEQELKSLPAEGLVYAGTVYTGGGAFSGTGHKGGRPRDIHVLIRGDIQNRGPEVGPGTLNIISQTENRWNIPPQEPEHLRRAKLAQWLVREDHPLTWRTIVNRVWLYHFGRGIVDSPGDFGRMGQQPTHPELLDWLAVEFRDGGQSLKSLHRLMCNSATYRQASFHHDQKSEIDGGNRFYWRANRRRLEAECVRDATLLAAGKLNTQMYGPGFQCFVIEKPQHSPHYQYHKFDPHDPAAQRRSIYRFIVRSAPDPFMETLDCADPSQLVDKRNETITALGALALLNNQFMVAMAEQFAERLEKESDDRKTQLETAFQLTLSRSATEEEVSLLADYAKQHGLAATCRLILNMNEFVFVD